MDAVVGVRAAVFVRTRHLQTHIVVVLVFLVLVTLAQLLGNHRLNSQTRLSRQRVELAVTLVVHVVRSHKTTHLRVIVKSFELLAFGIAMIFQRNWIISQS